MIKNKNRDFFKDEVTKLLSLEALSAVSSFETPSSFFSRENAPGQSEFNDVANVSLAKYSKY